MFILLAFKYIIFVTICITVLFVNRVCVNKKINLKKSYLFRL